MARSTTPARKLALLSRFDQRLLAQFHNQSCILEQHEKQIAKHTRIQSWIALIQLLFGVVTTVFLVYVAFLQFEASERQVSLADRQVRLEYAKVAPQFSTKVEYFPLKLLPASEAPFPRSVKIRILRGEVSLQDVRVVQELTVARLSPTHAACTIYLSNYFGPLPGNVTDFVANPLFEAVAADPAWHEDKVNFRNFVVVSAGQTRVEIRYRDVFGEDKVARFAGSKGALSQIPSGGFSSDTLYEGVEARLKSVKRFVVPGAFEPEFKPPQKKACRRVFGLA